MTKSVSAVTDQETLKQALTYFRLPVTREQFVQLVGNHYSDNSILALTKDWNLFLNFCSINMVMPLPASATAVRLFIERQSEQRKYATLRRYNVTISVVHRVFNLADPTATATVQKSLAQLRVKKSGDARPTTAFDRSHLVKLQSLLSTSSKLTDIRNLALYFVMFECALKRSELKNLKRQNAVLSNGRYVIHVKEQQYALSKDASTHLSKWLSHRIAKTSPLFSAIDKHGNINKQPLNDSSIYRILNSASKKLNLDVSFSGQSLRVGAVRELSKQGKKVADIQKHGRWLSPVMPYQYLGDKTRSEAEMVKYKRFKAWD
ncbi:tyrosine-type recombinase/integrase [Vibrio sp. TRT 21S02]|uniref:tyrosine-type recombinase/integrase n=1 Tax=Vibrio sp. TRT 21S02 TaxID=3418507 RepID=UPI003CEB3ACC